MSKTKRMPAPLDEKNVVKNIIECDIFPEGCAHQQKGNLHIYLGFYKGHPMMLWFTHGKNYLKVHFMNRLLNNKPVLQQIEDYMTQGNDDTNNNQYVISRRGNDLVEFNFLFKYKN